MANIILFFLTGLALFLIGMFQLGTTVQRAFSVRIRENIRQSVKKPIYGLLIGLIATILAQSSSATTVLTVGMVSAGLINFYHSLGIILGADIGTTLTAQLVIFKFTDIAPCFIIIGVLLWLTCKDQWKIFGKMLFYFGLLFFGLALMADTMAPLKDSPFFIGLFKEIKNPFLGILIGIIFTLIVQASAVPIIILIFLARHNMVTLESAFPIVLGANIGTTVDAFLASFGTNINGKRVALAHSSIKILGTLIILPFLIPFYNFLKTLTPDIPQQIAFSHILFNLIIVIIFFSWLKFFARLIEKILPGEVTTLPLWPEYLNKKYLNQPELALDAVSKELKRQLIIAQKIFLMTENLINNFSKTKMRDIQYAEHVVDNLQREIAKFLDKISETKLSNKEAGKLLHYAQIVDDIERIGDQSTNIAKLARYKANYDITFSKEAKIELEELYKQVNQSLDDVIDLIEKYDFNKVQNIFSREELIDQMTHNSKENHFQRFFNNICSAEAGPIFIDILVNLERISDHCVNIAEYLTEIYEKYL